MTTHSSKSGSIYDTLFVSKMKKNSLGSLSKPQHVAFNLYDASQKKSGHMGMDRLAFMPQQSEKLNGNHD